MTRFGDETAVMSSPSRTSTDTTASSSRERTVVTGTDPTQLISQRSPGRLWPRASAALSTTALTCTGLHGSSLASATSASAAYAVRGSRRPARRASRKIRSVCARQAALKRSPALGARRALHAIHAVGIGPFVGAASAVQPARPLGIVGLGASAHLPAPVTETLHARRTSGVEQLRLGSRVSAGRARDLRGLCGRELAGAKGSAGLRQLIERA